MTKKQTLEELELDLNNKHTMLVRTCQEGHPERNRILKEYCEASDRFYQEKYKRFYKK